MLSASQQWLMFFAGLMGFLGVAIGAFGAHALKQKLGPEMLGIFEVGVRYQMYHVLAMGLVVWLTTVMPGMWPFAAGWLFFSGIVIFSGSLYILALTGVKAWGAVTPIGGLLLLFGWLCVAIGAFK